jgi:hypothetical protein
MFARAYMGRKRRGEAPSTVCLFLTPAPLSSPTGVAMSLWPTQGDEKRIGPATALYGTVALSFVIPTRISCHVALDKIACAPFSQGKAHEVRPRHQVPQEIRGSEAEGSAVPRTSLGNVEHYPQTKLSSRPERSAVERSAVFRKPSWFPLVFSGFVSGHDFSRAVKAATDEGFSPCGSSVRVRKVN